MKAFLNDDSCFVEATVSEQDEATLWELGYFGPVLNITEIIYLLETLSLEVEVFRDGKRTAVLMDSCAAFWNHLRLKLPDSQLERQRKVSLVYNDLRKRGWIVRTGLNYGCDFLLYTTSPEEEHSPYALLVQESSKNSIQMRWRDLLAHNRVVSTARKQLILALLENEVITYKLVERWLPERNRSLETQNS